MPTYVYKREDGTTFEVMQRITEEALETCPSTGQKVRRVISGAGLIFKGDGFYLTDYARKKTTAASPAPEGSSNGSSSDAKETKEATSTTPKADAGSPKSKPD